jgi:uncharacterized protein (TIGR00290 family)
VQNIILSWSGGKDSALALYEIRRSKAYNVVALLTTLTRDFDRISMHGVRRDLLMKQAESLKLPLKEVWIPKNASNGQYETQMGSSLGRFRDEKKVNSVAFGDLFLEDIRKYREERLSELGMKALFPLWHKDTKALANLFVKSGFRAIVCCVDPRKLEKRFCGMEFDNKFLATLPQKVDPCGENGEFHTFVFAGPIFEKEIEAKTGETVLRDGFYFTDILRK